MVNNSHNRCRGKICRSLCQVAEINQSNFLAGCVSQELRCCQTKTVKQHLGFRIKRINSVLHAGLGGLSLSVQKGCKGY